MADNAFVKILTALLKHHVKKVMGDEALGVLGQEITALGGDKVDDQIKSWLGEKTNAEQLDKAAQSAQTCFREKVADNEIQQWMVSLPLGDLPKVVEALNELPTSPDENKLENALRESVQQNWRKLSPKQIEHAVNSFLSCLRSALLPIEKQTLMVIGRSVLRTEDKVDDVKSTVNRSEEKIDLLIQIAEKRFITEKPVTIESLRPEPAKSWNLKHPYGMPAHFTGRVAERKALNDWLENNHEQPLFVLRALGGFGKSALTWYWLLRDVDKSKWTRVVWWSFYEGDASFDSFLQETLEYLVGRDNISPNARLQTEQLLKELEKPNVLLVMDGFERALRAFGSMGAVYQADDIAQAAILGGGDAAESKQSPHPPAPSPVRRGGDDGRDRDCVSQAAEEFLKGLGSLGSVIRSKVVMTTRLTPRILFAGAGHDSPLEGMIEAELLQMQSAEAVEFFQRQGIRGTHTEIETQCASYGYHPLSLRLLAGLVLKDNRQAGDIACASHYADKVSADLRQRQRHVLEQAYEALTPALKTLLGRLACFRSSMTYEAIEAINRAGENPVAANLDESLDELTTRGLLHRSNAPTGQLVSSRLVSSFDLHPIVRRYAYDRLTAPERTRAHEGLVNYFEAAPTPAKIEKLEDLAPVIELYHHTLRAGKLDEARVLFRDRLSPNPLYFQFGAYQLIAELLLALFIEGEDKPPRLKDESAQAWTLNELANAYSLNGQPRRAVPPFTTAITLWEKAGDKKNLAIGLGNVAGQQLVIGALREAERNLRRQIELCVEIGNNLHESNGHHELSRVLAYCGNWQKSEQEQDIAQQMFEKENHVQGQGMVWAYRALRFLLMARGEVSSNQLSVNSSQSSVNSAIECARCALELASMHGLGYPVPRDYIDAYRFLGAAYRASVVSIRPSKSIRGYSTTELEKLNKADENLSKAISICRQINLVDVEADILLELAKLRHAQNDSGESVRLAREALVIAERSGYVLQGADAHLWLGELAMKGYKLQGTSYASDKEAAMFHAREALRLATCDGEEYRYKVAYEEAERMLEQLGG